ncbi:AAA family ATPase [Bacillus cereus]|nr:AAA family ATPase [Bacillus cereus]
MFLSKNKAEEILIVTNTNASKLINFLNNTSYFHNIIPPIKTTIINAIKLEKVAHAYLLSGPRGTGKTTVAKIVGKDVNCLTPLNNGEPCQKCTNCSDINNNKFADILEFDAASNNVV